MLNVFGSYKEAKKIFRVFLFLRRLLQMIEEDKRHQNVAKNYSPTW